MADSCNIEFMEYINEDSIDPNLTCSICTKPLTDPVHTPCDHTFGRACIERWLRDKDHNSCPLCNKKPLLTSELVQASRPLRNMLDQLRVRCLLCEKTGIQRGNFLDHIHKFCPKAETQCLAADIKCPWKGPREALETHVSTCVFQPLRSVLSFLINENQQLRQEIQKLNHQICKYLQNKEDDEDSDCSSVSQYSFDDNNQPNSNAIFIRNLPANVRNNELFQFFSTAGRIMYDEKAQKPSITIFKNHDIKNGPTSARIIYADKQSVADAITQFNNKHVDQWNSRLCVAKWRPKRSIVTNAEKQQVNFTRAATTTTESSERPLNVNCQAPVYSELLASPNLESPQAATNKKPNAHVRRRKAKNATKDAN